MGIKLIGIEGPMRGKARELPSGEYSIGRGSECQVRIADDGNASRTHAVIRVRDGSAEIEDTGSKNGTWVNDQRVLVEELDDGDRVRIGDSVFRIARTVETTGPGQPPPPAQRQVRYAGFWVRLAAKLVDVLAVGLPLSLFYYLIAVVVPSVNRRPDWWAFIATIFGLVVYGAYFVWMDGSTGQTIGRRATGIRVIMQGGGPITYGQALTRFLAHLGITVVGPAVVLVIAGAVVYIMAGPENAAALADPVRLASKAGFVIGAVITFIAYFYILLAAHPEKRGWHDIAAETEVIVGPR